jgi:hypothetical protein
MDIFEIVVKKESFKVILNNADHSFGVFNHSTFHVVKKNDFGVWRSIVHRFGREVVPIDEIGDAIDKHYEAMQQNAANFG